MAEPVRMARGWLLTLLLTAVCFVLGSGSIESFGSPVPHAGGSSSAAVSSTYDGDTHGYDPAARLLQMYAGAAQAGAERALATRAPRGHADASSVRPLTSLDSGVAAKAANEGIYVVRSEAGTYVGQSGNITQRLGQHVYTNKFTQAEVDAAERISVPGGKTAREVAEQLKIDEFGGIDSLLNKVNPIGSRRFDLMPNQPYMR